MPLHCVGGGGQGFYELLGIFQGETQWENYDLAHGFTMRLNPNIEIFAVIPFSYIPRV